MTRKAFRPGFVTLLLAALLPIQLLGASRPLGATTQESSDSSCIVRCAAFDIGSGATKVQIADVDLCSQRVITSLMKKSEKVPFASALDRSENLTFPDEVMDSGILTIRKLLREAGEFNVGEGAGVATAAFRRAENAETFVQKVFRETGIRVRIISQREEALLGYQAAVARADMAKKNILVWDIGGASMQMTALSPARRFLIYKGTLASVTFRDHILGEIQERDLYSARSPNPMTRADVDQAVQYAKEMARQVPDDIRALLRNGIPVVGIGGVHFFSIRGQVGASDSYTVDQVRNALANRFAMTDAQIGGDHANTEISNLALVLGYMEELRIRSVRVVNIDLTDGILTNAGYWDTSDSPSLRQ